MHTEYTQQTTAMAQLRMGGMAWHPFLADRTIGRAYGTVCRLSSVCRLWRFVLWQNGAS